MQMSSGSDNDVPIFLERYFDIYDVVLFPDIRINIGVAECKDY